MEYYSAIRKDEMLPFATTWMGLATIMLNEISHAEKDKKHMRHLCMEYKTESSK